VTGAFIQQVRISGTKTDNRIIGLVINWFGIFDTPRQPIHTAPRLRPRAPRLPFFGARTGIYAGRSPFGNALFDRSRLSMAQVPP
jgi:hypothetical protein